MSATVPRIELLTENIVDVLEGVTRVNNYNTTITQVTRASKVGHDADSGDSILAMDCGVAVYEMDPEPTSESCFDAADWWQPYALVCVVFESKTSLEPPRKRLQIMRADIMRAMMIDITRGGNAQDTLFDPPKWVNDADAWGAADGIVLYPKCRYRESLSNPYTDR